MDVNIFVSRWRAFKVATAKCVGLTDESKVALFKIWFETSVRQEEAEKMGMGSLFKTLGDSLKDATKGEDWRGD